MAAGAGSRRAQVYPRTALVAGPDCRAHRVNLAVRPEDLGVGAFYNKGGQFAAQREFGEGLPALAG